VELEELSAQRRLLVVNSTAPPLLARVPLLEAGCDEKAKKTLS